MVYNTGTEYVLVQGPNGLPMAVPVQGRSDEPTFQGSYLGPQKGQPQPTAIPISGEVEHHTQTESTGLVAGKLSSIEPQALYPQLMPMPASGQVAADTSRGVVAGYPPQHHAPQQNEVRWS